MHAAVSRTLRVAASVLLATMLLASRPATGQEGAAPAPESVAIVVHPEAPVDALTLDQLRRIFLAEQQFWSDGSRITLLVRAPAAYERDVVLNVIYRMTEDEFRKYWVGKMFRAEVPAGPKIVYSSEMAGELVTAVPGAIGFVPAGDVMEQAKVIRIDGRLPGESGYPLQ